MMKTKTSDKWICALFCLGLGMMLALFLLLPRERFSEKEKRVLAEPPRLSGSDILSGRFSEDAESYAADHLPFRDFLVGLNARFEQLTGRQTTREVYLCSDGRLVEAPAPLDEEVIAENLEALNAFAAAAPCPVDLMLVPSAGCLLPEVLPALADPYEDEEILAAAYGLAGESLRPVELLPVFRAAEDRGALYYRTDHHWTAEGAWLACSAYLESLGREPLPRQQYRVRTETGFLGTTYARSGLWNTPAEDLELWDSGGVFLVENAENPGLHEGLFYEERLAENDKYPVYLDGNHSLVRIRNESGTGTGRLLVIRDSYANCLGCFLADAYEEVVLVDLRYYRSPVSQLLAEESFDRVLVLYSVGNFMTDGNLALLD